MSFPGVHIQEVERQPRPIPRTAATVAGIVGRTVWGPVGARFVSSWNRYRQLYGGFHAESDLPYAAFQFFNQGGNQLWVSRVVGPAAAKASVTVQDRQATPADTGTFSAKWVGDYGNDIQVQVADALLDPATRFRVLVLYKGQVVESHEELSPDPTSPDFAETVINGRSVYIDYDHTGLETAVGRPAAGTFSLTGGTDDWANVTPTEWLGSDTPGSRTGINAFKEIREITDVAAPGITNWPIQAHLIAHAEAMANRVANLDVALGGLPQDAVTARQIIDSKYAQVLYNRLAMTDPLTGQKRFIAPSAWYLGLRARAVDQLGVHESAANLPVRGAIDIELRLAEGDLALLTRHNVNPFVLDRGFRLWGSRAATADTLWTYITDRYWFNFAEGAIGDALKNFVHRTNGPELWRAIRRTIRPFLVSQEQANGGPLVGGEGTGWVLVVDETINDATTPYVYVDVGVATGKPAEFIVLRFSFHVPEGQVTVQETAEAQAAAR